METVWLKCPCCGELQSLPEDERDGESEWSIDVCDPCAEAELADPANGDPA